VLVVVVVVRGAWFGSEWRAGLLHRGIGEDDCMRERRPLSWAGGKGGFVGWLWREEGLFNHQLLSFSFSATWSAG
jgi:hypothetical protein